MSWTDVKAAKGAADAASAAVKTAIEHWQDCVSQVAKDLADPSKTSSDADPWKELQAATSEVEQTSHDAFKEQLKLRMLQAGAETEDVENWIDNHAKDVWDKAEALRQSKAAQAGAAKIVKVVHRLKVTVVSALFGFLAFAFGVQKYENMQHGDAKTAIENTIAMYQAQVEFEASITESEQMVKGLSLQDLPSTPEVQADMTVAQPPAPVALPPVVAAIAAQPITITVINLQGQVVEQITRTVEQVYQSSPVSRPYIESQISSSSSSGSSTNESSSGGHSISGWTVSGTPFGSFHFGS